MTALFLTLFTFLLTGIFAAVSVYETNRGVRFFEASRTEFDRVVERVFFVLQHVDFAAFIRDEVKRIGKKIGHDVVHFTLQGIRSVERILTRVVKSLRSRDPMQSVSRDASRPFIETLSNFKEHLEATRPPVPPASE